MNPSFEMAGRSDHQLAALEPWHQHIRCVRNKHPVEENDGADAFMATCAEFPGVVTLAPTSGKAKAHFIEVIAALRKSAAPEELRGMEQAYDIVQFNMRIAKKHKLAISQRAREAGMSTPQFVINQCLRAPVQKPAAESPQNASKLG